MWIAQRSSPYPNLAGDLLRRQRRGRNPLTAAKTSDRRLLAVRRRSGDHVGRASYRAGEGVQRNFQIFARDYIKPDPVGVTEKFKSVAPRLKTQINLMISVGPKWRNRSDRESQRGFGSLSL